METKAADVDDASTVQSIASSAPSVVVRPKVLSRPRNAINYDKLRDKVRFFM